MSCEVVPETTAALAGALRQAAARLEVIAGDRAVAAQSATDEWGGWSRSRFDRDRTRQSALAAHLVAQGHRLAVELEAG